MLYFDALSRLSPALETLRGEGRWDYVRGGKGGIIAPPPPHFVCCTARHALPPMLREQGGQGTGLGLVESAVFVAPVRTFRGPREPLDRARPPYVVVENVRSNPGSVHGSWAEPGAELGRLREWADADAVNGTHGMGGGEGCRRMQGARNTYPFPYHVRRSVLCPISPRGGEWGEKGLPGLFGFFQLLYLVGLEFYSEVEKPNEYWPNGLTSPDLPCAC